MERRDGKAEKDRQERAGREEARAQEMYAAVTRSLAQAANGGGGASLNEAALEKHLSDVLLPSVQRSVGQAVHQTVQHEVRGLLTQTVTTCQPNPSEVADRVVASLNEGPALHKYVYSPWPLTPYHHHHHHRYL